MQQLIETLNRIFKKVCICVEYFIHQSFVAYTMRYIENMKPVQKEEKRPLVLVTQTDQIYIYLKKCSCSYSPTVRLISHSL